VLLYGPPGTGKTLFARALAGEVNLPFIHLKPENYGSIYVYGASLKLREALQVIEQVSPALVFTDEVDRLAQKESECGDGASQERNDVLKQLLACLGAQERKWIAVGTTNVPNLMNRAFTRSGRFSLYIPFLYPDQAARRQILLAHLGLQGHRPKPPMDEQSVRQAVETVAAATEFYSGSDLEELVNQGKLIGFRGNSPVMTGSHLIEAHKACRVETDARRKQEAEYRAVKWEFSSSPECDPMPSTEHDQPNSSVNRVEGGNAGTPSGWSQTAERQENDSKSSGGLDRNTIEEYIRRIEAI
jgi:SpoVK/Ycf46/Vps4 family AAA+-type ATPase